MIPGLRLHLLDHQTPAAPTTIPSRAVVVSLYLCSVLPVSWPGPTAPAPLQCLCHWLYRPCWPCPLLWWALGRLPQGSRHLALWRSDCFSPGGHPFQSVGLVLLRIAVTSGAVGDCYFCCCGDQLPNFMDGLDGLVAGCMAVAMTSAAIQLSAPLPIWVLVGALLGFLLWNWSPAKVFMGDVGSTFLGAVFAVLVLQSRTWPEAFGLLLVATPLLGDACLCVLRRLMHGQRVFQAHRLHLYQRLHQGGWPHARVSSHYIAATAVLAFALTWGGLHWVITLAALQLLLGFWLDQKVAVPFAVASRH